jgi:hypothetical protein
LCRSSRTHGGRGGGRSSASEDERGEREGGEIIRGSSEFSFLFGASNIVVNRVNGVCVLRKRERRRVGPVEEWSLCLCIFCGQNYCN